MCGQTLHEFEMNKHLKSIITFDAHDPGVEHSIHYTEFDNIFPSNVLFIGITFFVAKSFTE